MLGTALILLMPLVAWVLPGYLLSRWLFRSSDWLERGVLSLSLGMVTVAPLAYLASVVLGVATSPLMVLLVSALISSLAIWAGKRGGPGADAEPSESNTSRLFLLVALLVTGVHAFLTMPYAVSAVDVFWHCPHLAALYLVEEGSGGGLMMWDPYWGQQVHHLFAHTTEPAFGLGPVTAIQRAGNAAVVSQLLVFLGAGAPVIGLWCAGFLVFGSAGLLARKYCSDPGAGIVAYFFWYATRELSAYHVNENFLALGLSGVALHVLVSRRLAPDMTAALAGVVFGHLLGIRPALLMVFPSVILLCSTRRAGVVCGIVTLFAATPWLLTNLLAHGNPFVYPQLTAGQVEQSFLGWSFSFHPLNWPVADTLMTSPHHPFPTLIRLPLEVIQAFGAVMVGAGLAGLWGHWEASRRNAVAFALWMGGIPLFLMMIVALDYQKQSYVLLSMAPLPLLVGWAASQIKYRYRLIGASIALVLAVPYGLPAMIGPLPVDERKHIDHSYDPRDALNPDELVDLLTYTPAVTPRLIEGDGSWFLPQTLSLVGNGGLPRLAKSELPAPAALTVVWSSLQGDLPKPWLQRTTEEPALPPELIGEGGVPGKGPVVGRTGYVVALHKNATDTVKVAFHKTPSGPVLNVTTSGEKVEGVRYLNLVVVDRAQSLGTAPRLVLNGEYINASVIAMHSGSRRRPTSQALVVSNERWGIGWSRNGYAASILPLDAGASAGQLECESEQSSVVKNCIQSECVWTLTDSGGQPVAHWVPDARGVSGERLFTWSVTLNDIGKNEGRCYRQFLAIGD